MIDNPLNRLKVKRGEALPQARLTAAQVIEARQLNQEARQAIRDLQDEFSAKGLAKRYGVHYRTIERALSGETWSHLA